jgi:regulatory protein
MVLIDERYLEERFGVSKKGSASSLRHTKAKKSAKVATPNVKLNDGSQGHPVVSDQDEQEEPQKTRDELDQEAFAKLVKLISFRDRSIHEARTRLTEYELNQTAIESAVSRAIECGLLDDARFADVFIRSKVSAGKGQRAIEQGLKKHAIEAEEVPGYPEDYFSDDQMLETALDKLRRKPIHAKDRYSSAVGRLIRAGYPYGLATQAVRLWLAEEDEANS